MMKNVASRSNLALAFESRPTLILLDNGSNFFLHDIKRGLAVVKFNTAV